MSRKLISVVVCLVLILVTLACGGSKTTPTSKGEPTVEATEKPAAPAPTKTEAPAPSAVAGEGSLIRQWAASAAASSEYGDPDWAATQATGKPDTPECGDYVTAWASANSDTVEWIELSYTTPVIPTEINIYQTYLPDQVVKVEMIDLTSTYYTVYTAEPRDASEKKCPYVLSIPIEGADYPALGLRITIDQSVLGLEWNEIDAVELVGVSE